ncbi:cell division protein FtsQ [bacterium BMS3Abin09]|nr:cell division protein FtsQ [bacterium BMS3Abin09]GBE40805.1 cell division protein FtsQ [bacterium BMS3Bbin09]HDN94545.1 FtsQ-type POTRA domain-containing protein [Nitrospirota bacterium]
MRSKKKITRKVRKPAYRRGEKLAIYLKRGTLVLLACIVVAALVLGTKLLTRHFSVNEIIVSGNYHLDKEDIVKSMKITKGQPLLDIRSEDINERLRENPWIKSVALKKQFPGTLLIKVEEAVPKALLSIKKKLYIIDENGNILERIKGESTLFLPVLKGISPKNKKDITEALKLISLLSEKNILSSMESVEIGTESYGLFINMDGELIKVGYGDYSEKFERWIELEPEIRKRGVLIKYIDLRFKDSVIVKPMEKIKKGKLS